jgi:hypothetical protein
MDALPEATEGNVYEGLGDLVGKERMALPYLAISTDVNAVLSRDESLLSEDSTLNAGPSRDIPPLADETVINGCLSLEKAMQQVDQLLHTCVPLDMTLHQDDHTLNAWLPRDTLILDEDDIHNAFLLQGVAVNYSYHTMDLHSYENAPDDFDDQVALPQFFPDTHAPISTHACLAVS